MLVKKKYAGNFVKKLAKRSFRWFLIVCALLVLLIIYCDWRISCKSRFYIFDDVKELPFNRVGLVLGTSKFSRFGGPNLYFENRIDAAVALYKAGKIKYIVVSGDNRHLSYNEPVDMKKALIKRGIPEKVIFLDYAGFRTLDSVIRCKEIFGQNNFTIISQKFHNQRAVFLARKYGLNAIAYNAEDVMSYGGFLTMVRERFARVKVFIDLYIINKKPHFLGESIPVK